MRGVLVEARDHRGGVDDREADEAHRAPPPVTPPLHGSHRTTVAGVLSVADLRNML